MVVVVEGIDGMVGGVEEVMEEVVEVVERAGEEQGGGGGGKKKMEEVSLGKRTSLNKAWSAYSKVGKRSLGQAVCSLVFECVLCAFFRFLCSTMQSLGQAWASLVCYVILMLSKTCLGQV